MEVRLPPPFSTRVRSNATLLEVIVSPEDDAEIRRLSITNHGLRVRQLEVTSYLEVVLAPPAADLAREMLGPDNRVSLVYVPAESTADSQANAEVGEPVGASR